MGAVGAEVENDVEGFERNIGDNDVEDVGTIAGVVCCVDVSIHHVAIAFTDQSRARWISDVRATVSAIIENESGGGSFSAGEGDGGTRGFGSPGKFVVLPTGGLPFSKAGGLLGGESQVGLPTGLTKSSSSFTPEVDANDFDSGQESRGGEGDPGKKEGV